MCGICGIFNYGNHENVSSDVINRMTKSIVHRGPDDEGFYYEGHIGLGFRRLSIIDLQGGHQPMSDNEGKIWIVFNGEIYNFPELKKELQNHGYVFKTDCDTEVIIYGYKEWGVDVFNHLNGMFGLAIWDKQNQRLILARDAMGIKVVYYKTDAGSLVFGSEIKAIQVSMQENVGIDTIALNLFLRYRYTSSPFTLFNGIRKLAPGQMMIVENDSYRIERWYKFKPRPMLPLPSADEAMEELLSIYKRSVKRQLISDVPLGLLLSGGIDSGLLLGLMSLYGESWKSYSVGYGSSFKDDELKDAAETARIFQSNHFPIMINRKIFESSLSLIVSSLEEPVATSSIVPMYHVCKRASQDVKVVFVGQGPDELFGGYVRHLGVRYGALWRKIPGLIRDPITWLAHTLPRSEALKRGVYALGIRDRLKRYQHVFSLLPGERINNLFQDGLISNDTGDKILDTWKDLVPLMEETDELGGFQFLEVRTSLPDELLMYGDKLSMAHGLEVRVPYLDREVVEFAECLPAQYKVKFGSQKWLHHGVCKDFLPQAVLNRKSRGFATNVVDDWFRESMSGNIKSMIQDSKSIMYRYLSEKEVKALLSDHVANRSNNYKILFSLIVFETWLRHQNIR